MSDRRDLLTRLLRRVGVRGPFEPTRLVWSRGLALLCDRNGGVAFVREQHGGKPPIAFDSHAYAGTRDGDLVWVRLIALPQFVEEVLPRIGARFALVTGDEDWSVPTDFDRAQELLASDKVMCWFTQNFDGRDSSGKIYPLPIGIDFHTISNGRRWGHPMATPAEQEAELDVLRSRMPRNADRLLRVHADFHFNKHSSAIGGETRHSVEELLRANPCVDFQHEKIPRLDLWREKTRYAFVVSPHGNGLDCHRTWESLVLGNIVIVRRSSLDALYEGLPVVIIDRWEQITHSNLRRWHEQYRDAFSTTDVQRRLTNQYWIERIRRVLAERLSGDQATPGHHSGSSGIDPAVHS